MYRADRESGRSTSRSLVFSLTVLIIRDSPPPIRAPPSSSLFPSLFLSLPLAHPSTLPARPCLRPSSGYLLGFYLWSRSQCNRPIWTGARSNFPIIPDLLRRTKLLPAGPHGRRRAGRPGFRERSKALWVIRSGIIFRRVLFQFINKDS